MKVDLSPIKDQLAVIQQGIRQHFNAMSDETGAWNEVCTYLTKLEMGIAPPITVIAPVVELGWKPCKEGWDADYNEVLYARIVGSPLTGFAAEVRFNWNIVGRSNFHTDLERCEAEARAWCVEQITKIVTPTPRT